MAAFMLSFSRSVVSASRPVRGPACAGERSVCRLSVLKAQHRDAVPATKADLTNGVVAPALAGLAATLTTVNAVRAEEVTEAAGAASSGAGGFGTGEVVLLLTPVIVYALFNLYRDKLNPQAKFLDYIYLMVALAIFGNIFSILVFKTRFF